MIVKTSKNETMILFFFNNFAISRRRKRNRRTKSDYIFEKCLWNMMLLLF